jgi:hypothetical protein
VITVRKSTQNSSKLLWINDNAANITIVTIASSTLTYDGGPEQNRLKSDSVCHFVRYSILAARREAKWGVIDQGMLGAEVNNLKRSAGILNQSA